MTAHIFNPAPNSPLYLCKDDILVLTGAALVPKIDLRAYAIEVISGMSENKGDIITSTKEAPPARILFHVLNQAHKNITKRLNTLENYKTNHMGKLTTLQLKNLIRTHNVALSKTEEPLFDSKRVAVQQFRNIGDSFVLKVYNATYYNKKRIEETINPNIFDANKFKMF